MQEPWDLINIEQLVQWAKSLLWLMKQVVKKKVQPEQKDEQCGILDWKGTTNAVIC